MKTKVNVDNFSIGPKTRGWAWALKRRHLFSYLKNRYQWYYYPTKLKVPDFPLHVDFETSAACNLKCPMCWRFSSAYDEAQYGNMNFDLFKKGIDECVKYKLYSIRLSWRGECTVNPKLIDMVAYAKEKGIKEVSFISNGYKIEGGYARDLVKSGIDYITISVDALGPEYDKIRTPSTFEGIVERLKDLRSLRDSVGKGYPRLRINSTYKETDDPDWFSKMYDYFGSMVDFMTFTPEYSHDGKVKQLMPNFTCQYPFQRLTIMWDGVIPLCITDKIAGWSLGNLNADNIYDIWHGKKMNEARKIHKSHNAAMIQPCSICDRAVTKQIGNQNLKR